MDQLMRSRSFSWALGLLALGCAHSPSSAPSGAAPLEVAFTPANPFAQPSSLQYEAPQFNRIRNRDYQSAIEEGMRRQLREVDSIARQTAEPTFENTIVAMERTGVLLTRSLKVFGGVANANTNDTLQEIQTAEAPKLAAHSDAIYLNPRLFQRVERRSTTGEPR